MSGTERLRADIDTPAHLETSSVTSEVRARALDDIAEWTAPLGAVAQRWASYVYQASASEIDPKTIQIWARLLGVSYTSLRECCRLVEVRPYDARDLARTLRALIQSARSPYHPRLLLDVSDERTLKALIQRAGPGFGSWTDPSAIDRFLIHQRFVRPGSAGLDALRKLLAYRFLRPSHDFLCVGDAGGAPPSHASRNRKMV